MSVSFVTMVFLPLCDVLALSLPNSISAWADFVSVMFLRVITILKLLYKRLYANILIFSKLSGSY